MSIYSYKCDCGNSVESHCDAQPNLFILRKCLNCGNFAFGSFSSNINPEGYKLRGDTLSLYNSIVQVFYEIQDKMTVRQVFYQLSTKNAVEKTENGYRKVARALKEMRLRGYIDWEAIVDNSRWMRKPTTHSSLRSALENTKKTYRRALWEDQAEYIEIWLEKDALSGIFIQVTGEFDVPLMVQKGFSSLSFVYESARYIKSLKKPAYIYQFGDYDPSGVAAYNSLQKQFKDFGATVEFRRMAVTPEQIETHNLPTRPTKKSDTRSKNFSNLSCELDAMTPKMLKDLVRKCIVDHIHPEVWSGTLAAENAEKETLDKMLFFN